MVVFLSIIAVILTFIVLFIIIKEAVRVGAIEAYFDIKRNNKDIS